MKYKLVSVFLSPPQPAVAAVALVAEDARQEEEAARHQVRPRPGEKDHAAGGLVGLFKSQVVQLK